MLDIRCRQMFKKGKLYDREGSFYVTLCYESTKIRVERIYNKNDKDEVRKMYNLIGDLYFEYEFDGTPLSNRQLAILYGVNHQTMNNIVNDAIERMRNEMARAKRCI